MAVDDKNFSTSQSRKHSNFILLRKKTLPRVFKEFIKSKKIFPVWIMGETFAGRTMRLIYIYVFWDCIHPSKLWNLLQKSAILGFTNIKDEISIIINHLLYLSLIIKSTCFKYATIKLKKGKETIGQNYKNFSDLRENFDRFG